MEIIDATLRVSGWPDAKTVREQRWVDAMPSFETSHFLDGFPTHDKTVSFRARLEGARRQSRRDAETA